MNETVQKLQRTGHENQLVESGYYEAMRTVFTMMGLTYPEGDAGADWYIEKIRSQLEQRKAFDVGDTLRMPHITGGYRVWNVSGVHLGAENQEGTYHLTPVDWSSNETIHVPCEILETHPRIEKI